MLHFILLSVLRLLHFQLAHFIFAENLFQKNLTNLSKCALGGQNMYDTASKRSLWNLYSLFRISLCSVSSYLFLCLSVSVDSN